MSKSEPAKSASKAAGSEAWIARDAKSGRFVEVKSANRRLSTSVLERTMNASGDERRPGRFKGVLVVGREFFEPLSEDDLAELNGT